MTKDGIDDGVDGSVRGQTVKYCSLRGDKVVVHRETTEYYDAQGKLHRNTSPAVVESDGSKFWYKHGVLHREDGFAIEYPEGTGEWWINGNRLTEEEFNSRAYAGELGHYPLHGKIMEIDGKKYKLEAVNE
jgi:hypothetical protein